MSSKEFDLGAVSAYALAVEKGYQGTEEEFALLQMESADNARVAVEAAGLSVEKAAEALESAVRAGKESLAIQNMSVESETLDPGSSATVTKVVDPQGVMTLTFGVPSGMTGKSISNVGFDINENGELNYTVTISS